jgi:hypothetical protein
MTRPPASAPSAVTVSDRTCEPVLGTDWRTLRRFCHERGIAIGHIGRRPVVRAADVLAALALGDAASSTAPAWDKDANVARAAAPRARRAAR